MEQVGRAMRRALPGSWSCLRSALDQTRAIPARPLPRCMYHVMSKTPAVDAAPSSAADAACRLFFTSSVSSDSCLLCLCCLGYSLLLLRHETNSRHVRSAPCHPHPLGRGCNTPLSGSGGVVALGAAQTHFPTDHGPNTPFRSQGALEALSN